MPYEPCTRSVALSSRSRRESVAAALSEKSAFEAFARMEEKIADNERRMIAAGEIDEEFSGDRLSHEFKRLEKSAGSANADMQLLALKQKLGMLPAGAPPQEKRQLGAGAAPEDTVHDAEVEEEPAEEKEPK